MRLHEILHIIKNNLYLGIIGIIALSIIGSIGYFFIYRRLLGGRKRFTKKQIILGGLLTGYVIMVIGVTFLNRGGGYLGGLNLHFLSSYREAWNSFSTRAWQQVILNIVMFLPLGILLPFCHPNFRKIQWTIGVALVFTLFIEVFQLATGFGIFELDDLFNNALGALIGYGMFMGIWTILHTRKQKFLKTVGYFSPFILVVAIFMGIFITYDMQEFGNLYLAHHYKINMEDVDISLDIEPKEERVEVPIYQAPSYTPDSAKKFAIEFFGNLGIDTQDMEIDAYNTEAIFWIRDTINGR